MRYAIKNRTTFHVIEHYFSLNYLKEGVNLKFSIRMDRLKPSAIRDVQKKIAAKPDVISFAAGLPDPDLFPLDDYKKATDDMITERGAEAFQYGLTKGYGPMLDILVDRLAAKEKINCTKENLCMTTGATQGLALVANMVLDEGDYVLTESPSYLGAINCCRPYGINYIGVATDDEGMDVNELEEILSTNDRVKMIYVIPNFQNPTGKAWSLERRKAFMEVVNKYDVLVVEDNPYGELRFKGDFVPSLKALDTQDKVVYLGSFSKIMAPGLRIAYLCGDPKIAALAEELKETTDLQCNEYVQVFAVQYMQEFDLEAHIEKIKALYLKKCDLMLEEMDKYFPENIKIIRPEGGMFIWFELPEGLDSTELLQGALDAGVAYIPGESFYPTNPKKNGVRLNFTLVSEEQIKEGIKILGDYLKTVC